MQSWLVNNMIPILGGNQGFSSATAVVVVVIVVGVGVERIAASGRFDQQWLLARTFDSFRCRPRLKPPHQVRAPRARPDPVSAVPTWRSTRFPIKVPSFSNLAAWKVIILTDSCSWPSNWRFHRFATQFGKACHEVIANSLQLQSPLLEQVEL